MEANVTVADRQTAWTKSDPRRIAYWGLPVFFVALAFLDPRVRTAERFPSVAFCLILGFGLASAAWASAARLGAARFGAWCALAVIGQAAALQLISAGSSIGYQHYLLGGDLLSRRHLFALAIVAVQTVAVAWSSRQWLRGARAVLGSLSRIRLAVGVCVLLVSSAALSRSVVTYGIELVLATTLQMVNLLTVLHAAAHAPAHFGRRLRERFVPSSDGATSETALEKGWDRWVVWTGILSAVLSAFLSYFVYERHPHVPDEVAYLYQARYFSQAMMAMPAPPDARAFDVDLMTSEPTRWYSLFPPGWPAVLSLGIATGGFWLINPILSACNVLLAFLVLQRLVSRPSASLIAVLLAGSPWHIFLGMSLMSHTWTLTCLLLAALGVLKIQESGSVRWAAVGGFFAGHILLIRPMDALIAGIALATWLLVMNTRRLEWAATFAFILCSLLSAGLTLPYNKALTGESTQFPLMAYFAKLYGPQANALGFGPDRGFGWTGLDPFPGHGLRDVLVNSVLNVFAINVELLGWSCGSLALLIYCLCYRRLTRLELAMVAFIAVVIGFHGLYWFSGGPDFGARYWYLIIIPSLVLTARGLERLVGHLDATTRSTELGTRAVFAAALFYAIAIANFVPWRAIDKYHHYRGSRPDIRELAPQFGRSLVLIRGARAPDYASAAIYNPIDMRSDAPIYAWDTDPSATMRVLDAYKDRSVWFVEGPTLTRGRFRIVAGPIPAAVVIAHSLDSR